ncbi:MAG: cytochrome c maturation protein CcmE, partial [Stenotrophomonas sp.]
MTPTQRRRLLLVVLVLAVAGVAVALVTAALQRNIAYLYTPA